MYLNMIRCTKELLKWSLIALPAFLGSLVFLGTAIEYGEAVTIPVFLVLEIICIVLMVKYVQAMSCLYRFRAMNDCFRADSDGSVPAEQLAEYLGITTKKLDQIRRYGEKTKILVNIVYDSENNRFILTDRYKPVDRVKDLPFIGMSCPGCGANLKIRAGSIGICPYCDRNVTAPNITIG